MHEVDFVDSRNNILATDHFHLIHCSIKISLASNIGVWAQQEPTGGLHWHINVRRGRWSLVSPLLTCSSELFQVWNMAATETQLMSSVALIGKCRFSCLFLHVAFLKLRLLTTVTWYCCDSHDVIVTQENNTRLVSSFSPDFNAFSTSMSNKLNLTRFQRFSSTYLPENYINVSIHIVYVRSSWVTRTHAHTQLQS